MELKDRDIKVKKKAYKKLLEWTDETMTLEFFFKSLHLTVKEKHQSILPLIAEAIISVIEGEHKDEAISALNFDKFLSTFVEHTMSNAKKPNVKESINKLIVSMWNNMDQNQIKENLGKYIKSIKPKSQQNTLIFLTVLLENGKIEELGYLQSFFEHIEGLINGRTKTTSNLAMDLVKEAFLWMGIGIKASLKKVKEEHMKKLDKYFESVDEKSMKKVVSKTGKAKKFDAFEMA